MRTIAHLSDLHFGRVDPEICKALHRALIQAAPDVVVVSGDLTQRARAREFRAARDFLDTLPWPLLIVPGNHDVPLYNPWARFVRPLARYAAFISHDLQPFYSDQHVAILGVNTARSLTFKDGRISRNQLDEARIRLAALPAHLVRIVVTHHPFEGRSEDDTSDVVGRAAEAMQVFAGCRVDLVLSGHLHVSRIGHSAARYDIAGFSALLIQAGTAMSSRRRVEANAFNLIRLAGRGMILENWLWREERASFQPETGLRFRRGSEGWAPADDAQVPEVVQVGEDVVVAFEGDISKVPPGNSA